MSDCKRCAELEREVERLRERCGELGELFVTSPGEPTRLTAPPTATPPVAAYEAQRDVSGDDLIKEFEEYCDLEGDGKLYDILKRLRIFVGQKEIK